MMMSSPGGYTVREAERILLGPDAIPTLRLMPDGADQRRFPGMILQHGYGADKYDLEPVAEQLAGLGLVVFLPDAWGHGERFNPRGPNWMQTYTADYFIAVVRQVVADLLTLSTVARQEPAVDAQTVLLGGFSLGGMAAIVATEQAPEIAGLLAIAGGVAPTTMRAPLGMPLADGAEQAWAQTHDMAQPANAARLAPRPTLLIHGTHDDRLPVSGSERLYAAAAPAYASAPERLQLRTFPARHEITPTMMITVVEWLAAFFLPSQGT